ncbi:transposable element Tcb1 transposase [Trichonephila clavipes]|nr:transposable element Tcb1 transposase [Trichonephila clavipes]
MKEEAEKHYIVRGLKENRAIEIQLQSCSNIEELKEKMKLLDIQEKSKSSKNEVIYTKYPMTRIPYHTNQFAHRQQYGGWNWRNDQSQHPDTITNTRYKVYSPQFPSPYHHPSFSLQRPTLYPRNQQFPQRPTVLRPNAPTFYPWQRTQENYTLVQPHRTRELMIIQGRINFKQVDVLLDTGSSVNIIPKNIISQIKGYHNVEYIKTKIATINGEIEQTSVIRICDRLMQEGTTDRRGRSHPPSAPLHQSGLSTRRLLLGLPLSQNHRLLRCQWCNERRMWVAEWNEDVFTDESSISVLQHNDDRIRVWRHRGEMMLNSCDMHHHTGSAQDIMITPPDATPDQLWQRMEVVWSVVPEEHIQSLFESMPRRMALVISNNGGYSVY